MRQISNLLKKTAERSNGKMRVVKVPSEMRPTFESLKKLDTEISAQSQHFRLHFRDLRKCF